MTKHEKAMHEKLVLQNVALEKEVEKQKDICNNISRLYNRESGKVDALRDVVVSLVSQVGGRIYD